MVGIKFVHLMNVFAINHIQWKQNLGKIEIINLKKFVYNIIFPFPFSKWTHISVIDKHTFPLPKVLTF